jgi:AraC-like DNA-binding protein
MLREQRQAILGKIAAEVDEAVADRRRKGNAGSARDHVVARGNRWSVKDVLCTSGPDDRVFEEEHSSVSIALVVSGTFQYRATRDTELMTAGALLLGNERQCFECGHEHGSGDRCVSFHYERDYFEEVAAEACVAKDQRRFRRGRGIPACESASLFARATAAIAGAADVSWEEMSLKAVPIALQISGANVTPAQPPKTKTVTRIAESVRRIEREPGAPYSLQALASDAGLSEFRFLRAFRQVTGVTPHQFVLRTRLREAGCRLLVGDAKVIDVALSSGFGDLSNFNHAFRAELGATPTVFRAR